MNQILKDGKDLPMWGGIEGSKWRRQQLKGIRSKEEGGKQVQSKHTKASKAQSDPG